MRTSVFYLIFIIFPFFISAEPLAPDPAQMLNDAKALNEVKIHFNKKISELDLFLFTHQQALKNNPSKLEFFVNQKILSLWSAEKALKGLIGGKTWKNLSEKESLELKSAFNNTIQRYVREGMAYYDGQRLKLINVQTSAQKPRGMLTLELKPIYLPAFNINFRLIKKDHQWLVYDVLVQGVSYVKSKKMEYRRIIKNKGVYGLIEFLNHKNKQKIPTKTKTENSNQIKSVVNQ